jgi:hypothetical protein
MSNQRFEEIIKTLRHFVPCLRLYSGHLTAGKREIKDFPKLPSATSFIRKSLCEIDALAPKRIVLLKIEVLVIS